MTPANASRTDARASGLGECYANVLRALVRILGFASGMGLLAMVLITTGDVLMRAIGLSRPGAYDLVKIAAALTIAAALPYTTAIKGHVAIEYFFHQLGRRGRMVVDTLMRLGGMALFSVLAWGSLDYGSRLRGSGEVSLTLQLPIFWVPYVLAASCGLVVLIKLHHLLHPGQALIKP